MSVAIEPVDRYRQLIAAAMPRLPGQGLEWLDGKRAQAVHGKMRPRRLHVEGNRSAEGLGGHGQFVLAAHLDAAVALQAQGVDGVIIDLRRNGGGSLSEATELTGLFIEKGPVVQVRDSAGKIEVERDPDPEQVYEGPLAVLVDRNSASASEIFAGAIQDYSRGLIIGEPTFGKGTVQTLVDLGRFLRSRDDIGRLRLTMAQFFRVNGGSTQNRGVEPDIRFPSWGDPDEYGERALDNALMFYNDAKKAFTEMITAVKEG